jgi:hypothetical protein
MAMTAIDGLILQLIETGQRASVEEVALLVAHVSQAPFASYPSHVPPLVRLGLQQAGIALPSGKVRSVEWHLLKRIYLDQQWPVGTTEAEFIADLHQAIVHARAEVWTYRYYSHPYVGFLSPSHVQQRPQVERYIFVAYSPIFGTITTAYQTGGINHVFDATFSDLVQHR